MTFVYESIRRFMELLYEICGDYGIAIVWITVILRFCMAPFYQKQRQMKRKQQEMNQQAEEIKKKYRKNKEKANRELEKLYREESAKGMGFFLSFLQLPIMLILYNGIRRAVAADSGTVLLPWIPSLLARDSSYILPAMTVFVQLIPQLLPYLEFFKSLNLQKMSIPMMMIMLFVNGWFACMLPAGIELYYMVSGLFASMEQAVSYSLRLCKS